MEIENRHLR